MTEGMEGNGEAPPMRKIAMVRRPNSMGRRYVLMERC